MNCEEFHLLLDAYMDGALSPAEIEALNDHAKACDQCLEDLKAAQLLRETLAHIDDDLSVPLQAQAAWRNAVRAEAKKKSTRKWLRVSYAAAAALVVALGVGLFVQDAPLQPQQMQMTMRTVNSADTAVVAADGGAEAALQAHVLQNLRVVSLQDALAQLEQLALEYSGSFSAQGTDACVVTLPGDYLEDFSKAACGVGEQTLIENVAEVGDTATVLIRLSL